MSAAHLPRCHISPLVRRCRGHLESLFVECHLVTTDATSIYGIRPKTKRTPKRWASSTPNAHSLFFHLRQRDEINRAKG